jgi:hypothetical protein
MSRSYFWYSRLIRPRVFLREIFVVEREKREREREKEDREREKEKCGRCVFELDRNLSCSKKCEPSRSHRTRI